MEIKQPFRTIRIDGNTVTLTKDDGTKSVINYKSLEVLTLTGSITNGEGDGEFFESEDPENVEPTTNISTLSKSWRNTFKDFNLARIAMAVELGNNFENLSTFDKRIISRWFLTSYENRLTVVTEEEDKNNWDFLLSQTKVARDSRIEAARRAISYELTTAEATNLFDILAPYISGFSIANKPDLLNWINNQGAYVSNGFTQTGYYNSSRNKLLNDILKDGIY